MAILLSDRLRPIQSRQNALVKQLRKAFSQGEPTEDGCCAIESARMVEEAIRSGLRFRAVFFRASAEAQAQKLLPQLGSQVETLVLPDDVFAAATDTQTPQGVAALVKLHECSLEQVLSASQPFLVVASGVQDPGNLGTILRSAEAFGANGLLLTNGTVSPFNPKAVRASAGSLFRLPVLQVPAAELVPKLRERGLKLVATSSHKGTSLPLAEFSDSVAVFVGNEGAGLARDMFREMDEIVAIPHSPKVESLNAGVAASIVLYEISRRRLG